MTRAGRRRAKLLLSTACLAWMAAAGWFLFTDLPYDAVQHHKSDAVKEKMRECEGSFQQRYDCKEAIVIETGRKTFWNMTERMLMVFVPAMLLGAVGGWVIRRIPDDRPAAPPPDPDWKSRAQQHIAHPVMDDHHPSGNS
ncbi:MAG TPA: hypothetical protein VLL76_03135 [Candidatus Omnitrophota bacterium]|nr:hypothetical protein [Candidatus Omnitrophota bacterium]